MVTRDPGVVTLESIQRLRRLVDEHLWSREPLQPAPLAWLRNFVQMAIVIGEGFVRDHLMMRAHSLTFLTLLSIVPLLALAVSLLRLLGAGDGVLELLVEQFVAAGAPETASRLVAFVEGLDFAALGTVGGSLLIGTTIMTVGNVERSLNAIWGVQKQRTWGRRIPDYLAVLLVAPLLLGFAISLGTSLESQWVVKRMLDVPLLADLYHAGLRHAPKLLSIAGFTFLFWFMPNTRVRPSSALLGGIVAGVLFSIAQSVYTGAQIGAARYNAIFGGFASLPLLMVWIYFSWAITLLGAEVAYAHQTLPLYRREVRGAPVGAAGREAIGLGIALMIARAFLEGRPAHDEDGLSDELDVPLRTVRDVVARLEKAGVVAPVSDPVRQGVYQLARPAERITVSDVLDALRGPREVSLGTPEVSRVVEAVFYEIDARRHAEETRTLQELVEGGAVPPPGLSQAPPHVDPSAAGQ